MIERGWFYGTITASWDYRNGAKACIIWQHEKLYGFSAVRTSGWRLYSSARKRHLFLSEQLFHDIPYQRALSFFYVYEGTLSVTDEHHTCRLADRHAALLPISGPLTIEILKGHCHYFHMYISGLALLQFHTLLPSPLAYPTESSSMFTLFHTMEHLQNLQKDTFNDPLSVCRISMWITNILTEMAVYSGHPATRRDTIPDYLWEIHHLFDTQYGENYSLDELENTYSVSKYRICREFSKYYGASPVQYLNHKRIEEAKNCFWLPTTPYTKSEAR